MSGRRGIKNISRYHGKTVEELRKIPGRLLLGIFNSSRSLCICSCGHGRHCGDDVLSDDERMWNDKQIYLHRNARAVLKERGHISLRRERIPAPRIEKKDERFHSSKR